MLVVEIGLILNVKVRITEWNVEGEKLMRATSWAKE